MHKASYRPMSGPSSRSLYEELNGSETFIFITFSMLIMKQTTEHWTLNRDTYRSYRILNIASVHRKLFQCQAFGLYRGGVPVILGNARLVFWSLLQVLYLLMHWRSRLTFNFSLRFAISQVIGGNGENASLGTKSKPTTNLFLDLTFMVD